MRMCRAHTYQNHNHYPTMISKTLCPTPKKEIREKFISQKYNVHYDLLKIKLNYFGLTVESSFSRYLCLSLFLLKNVTSNSLNVLFINLSYGSAFPIFSVLVNITNRINIPKDIK